MEKNDKNMFTFLLGIAVGIAGALIYRENKKEIDDTVKGAVRNTQNKANKVFKNAKSKTNDIKNTIGDKLTEVGDNFRDQVEDKTNKMESFINDTKKTDIK